MFTGVDVHTVDRKHREAVELVPTLKLLFLFNETPRFRDRSSGVWRRLLLVPFRRQLSEAEADPGLARHLAGELPGLLNWAIAGLRRLLEQNRFTACPVCQAALEQHRLHCDPVSQFVDEKCVLAADLKKGDRGVCDVPKNVLYEAYAEWCLKSGHKPAAKNTFGGRIARLRGVKERRDKADRPGGKRPESWCGICLDGPRYVVPSGRVRRTGPAAPPPGLSLGETVVSGPNGKPTSGKAPAAKGKGKKSAAG
jgi:phage/plasmid-associated DNA primase